MPDTPDQTRPDQTRPDQTRPEGEQTTSPDCAILAQLLNSLGTANTSNPIILGAVSELMNGVELVERSKNARNEAKALPAKISALKKALKEAEERAMRLEGKTGFMEFEEAFRLDCIGRVIGRYKRNVRHAREFMRDLDVSHGDGGSDYLVSILEKPGEPVALDHVESQSKMTGDDKRKVVDAVFKSLNFTLGEATRIKEAYAAAMKVVRSQDDTRLKARDLLNPQEDSKDYWKSRPTTVREDFSDLVELNTVILDVLANCQNLQATYKGGAFLGVPVNLEESKWIRVEVSQEPKGNLQLPTVRISSNAKEEYIDNLMILVGRKAAVIKV